MSKSQSITSQVSKLQFCKFLFSKQFSKSFVYYQILSMHSSIELSGVILTVLKIETLILCGRLFIVSKNKFVSSTYKANSFFHILTEGVHMWHNAYI